MSPIPWSTDINFASALLLHSCTTMLLKESLNALFILHRLAKRHILLLLSPKTPRPPCFWIETSATLDAYTTIYSKDEDGELAELYFTNTGFLLLAVSLASSVVMNLRLSMLALNMIVAGTFGFTFVASLFVVRCKYTIPIMALRRSGRFIWSDTPFVNFFSLLYIATVLRGQSTLRLQDYVTFRCIAVVELVFMKAKLAASSPECQRDLMRRLVESERVIISAEKARTCVNSVLPAIDRDAIKAFNTSQRLSVMLLKTAVGYDLGGLNGPLGPSTCPIPPVGQSIPASNDCLKIYKSSKDTIIVADYFCQSRPKGYWARFIKRAHGVLLRRLGKIRVVYVLKSKKNEHNQSTNVWQTNANLVTGVSRAWLEGEFGAGVEDETGVFT